MRRIALAFAGLLPLVFVSPALAAFNTPAKIVGVAADVSPANINITAADVAQTAPIVTALQTIYDQTPTANSAAVFTLVSVQSATVTITGTFVGTLQSEISEDGVNFVAKGGYVIGNGAGATTFTQPAIFSLNVGSMTELRLRATAWTSGTATVSVTTAPFAVDTLHVSNLSTTAYGANIDTPIGSNLYALWGAPLAAQSGHVLIGDVWPYAGSLWNMALPTIPTVAAGNGVVPVAGATNGATHFFLESAATTNATNVKPSPGTLYHLSVQNGSATKEYVELIEAAGTPTCTTSSAYEIMIPASGSIFEDFAVGMQFTTGIAFCATTAIGGTGAVALGDLTINMTYK